MRNLYKLRTNLRTLHIVPVIDSGIAAAKMYPGQVIHLKVLRTLHRPLVVTSNHSAFVQVREIGLYLMENLGVNAGIWQYFLPNLPTNERKLFTPQNRTVPDGSLQYRFLIGKKNLFSDITLEDLWSGS